MFSPPLGSTQEIYSLFFLKNLNSTGSILQEVAVPIACVQVTCMVLADDISSFETPAVEEILRHDPHSHTLMTG